MVRAEDKAAVIEIEIAKVFYSPDASNYNGNPCVSVAWVYGVRL